MGEGVGFLFLRSNFQKFLLLSSVCVKGCGFVAPFRRTYAAHINFEVHTNPTYHVALIFFSIAPLSIQSNQPKLRSLRVLVAATLTPRTRPVSPHRAPTKNNQLAQRPKHCGPSFWRPLQQGTSFGSGPVVGVPPKSSGPKK